MKGRKNKLLFKILTFFTILRLKCSTEIKYLDKLIVKHSEEVEIKTRWNSRSLLVLCFKLSVCGTEHYRLDLAGQLLSWSSWMIFCSVFYGSPATLRFLFQSWAHKSQANTMKPNAALHYQRIRSSSPCSAVIPSYMGRSISCGEEEGINSEPLRRG